MDPVSARISIDAPRERVFDFLCDLANRAAITDHFAEQFRLQRLDPAGVGAAARFQVPKRGVWMETVIDQIAGLHLIYESGRAGRINRIPLFTVWELVEGPSGSCDATVSFWTEPTHPLDRLRERWPGRRRWWRRQWARALERLRDVIESERQVERIVIAGGDRVPGAG